MLKTSKIYSTKHFFVVLINSFLWVQFDFFRWNSLYHKRKRNYFVTSLKPQSPPPKTVSFCILFSERDYTSSLSTRDRPSFSSFQPPLFSSVTFPSSLSIGFHFLYADDSRCHLLSDPKVWESSITLKFHEFLKWSFKAPLKVLFAVARQ